MKVYIHFIVISVILQTCSVFSQNPTCGTFDFNDPSILDDFQDCTALPGLSKSRSLIIESFAGSAFEPLRADSEYFLTKDESVDSEITQCLSTKAHFRGNFSSFNFQIGIFLNNNDEPDVHNNVQLFISNILAFQIIPNANGWTVYEKNFSAVDFGSFDNAVVGLKVRTGSNTNLAIEFVKFYDPQFTDIDCAPLYGSPSTTTDAAEIETPEADSSESDFPETEPPQTETPEIEIPETENPETKPPETENPETETPFTDTPETETTGTETPEIETTGTETPETEPTEPESPVSETPINETPEIETPETETPETEPPETENPETETPDTDTPETEIPVTGTAEPEIPVTEIEIPETENPETEPPETENPETDTPETETTVTETPEIETPETETPETEPPETENPETEIPVTDTPEPEIPVTETPVTETPEPETPKTEIPTENPETDQPETDVPACLEIDFNDFTSLPGAFRDCKGKYLPELIIKSYLDSTITPHREASSSYLSNKWEGMSCIETTLLFSLTESTFIESAIFLNGVWPGAWIEFSVVDTITGRGEVITRLEPENNWIQLFKEVNGKYSNAQIVITTNMNAYSQLAVEYFNVRSESC